LKTFLASPAARPRYSVLGHEAWARVGLDPIGDWRYALYPAFPALLRTSAS
jgi:dTDP-4-dehydrorhamnose reductase